MPAVQPTEFRYTRAIITFFAAYVTVTLVAIALSMAAEAAMHNPPTSDMVHSPSYVFAEKFFPIINLLVWTAFSWVYFELRRNAPVLTGKLSPWAPSGSFSQFLWTTSASSSSKIRFL